MTCFRIALLVLTIPLIGCGSSTYNDRLLRTDARNKYFARLDRLLAGRAWQSGMTPNQPSAGLAGVTMRIPEGFLPVSEPQTIPPPKGQEGEEPQVVIHPDWRNYRETELTFPGVLGQWQGTFTSGGNDGVYQLYVIGNHERFRPSGDSSPGEPGELMADVELSLEQLFQVDVPEGDTGQEGTNNQRYRKSIPAKEEFTSIRTYSVIEFVHPTAELPFRAMMYELSNQQMHSAVILFAPLDLSPEVREKLLAALETFSVGPTPPAINPMERGAGSGPVGPGPKRDL